VRLPAPPPYCSFLSQRCRDHRAPHSFPTRRSSDLEAIGRAINSYEEDLQVVVIGSGGLSHQAEGARAGLINQEFDLEFMDSLTRSEEHTSELQSLTNLVCRLLLEKKNEKTNN